MNSFEQMLEFKTDRERLQAYTFQLRPSSGAARARFGGFAVTDGHEKALTTRAGANPTIGELFRARALIHKSSVAIEYQGRQISYGQLLDRVHRATSMLASQDLRRGDRVALLSRNRPEYLEVELAAANLGIITACLNWR
jgi:non-ribosomal peptide synthetase component F